MAPMHHILRELLSLAEPEVDVDENPVQDLFEEEAPETGYDSDEAETVIFGDDGEEEEEQGESGTDDSADEDVMDVDGPTAEDLRWQAQRPYLVSAITPGTDEDDEFEGEDDYCETELDLPAQIFTAQAFERYLEALVERIEAIFPLEILLFMEKPPAYVDDSHINRHIEDSDRSPEAAEARREQRQYQQRQSEAARIDFELPDYHAEAKPPEYDAVVTAAGARLLETGAADDQRTRHIDSHTAHLVFMARVDNAIWTRECEAENVITREVGLEELNDHCKSAKRLRQFFRNYVRDLTTTLRALRGAFLNKHECRAIKAIIQSVTDLVVRWQDFNVETAKYERAVRTNDVNVGWYSDTLVQSLRNAELTTQLIYQQVRYLKDWAEVTGYRVQR